MKMVAAAKLRKAQDAATASTPYQTKIEALLARLATNAQEDVHPFLEKRDVQKKLLVVFTSDRGLCGGFNNNLLKKVVQYLKAQTVETTVLAIGKKGISFFRQRPYPTDDRGTGYWEDFSHAKAKALMDQISDDFLAGRVDQVDIYFNEFVTVMSQVPMLKTLLPMQPPKQQDSGADSVEYTFEPDPQTILQTLIPRSVMGTWYGASLHSLAGEFGARMAAMDSASRNAGEMIDSLTLNMNRIRQAAITSELVEIISGAEAIK